MPEFVDQTVSKRERRSWRMGFGGTPTLPVLE